jgi:hypothetical protein
MCVIKVFKSVPEVIEASVYICFPNDWSPVSMQ